MSARRRPRWLRDAERVDLAGYAAVAATPTPALDRGMSVLSRAADRSALWVGCGVALAVARGERGRAATRAGLVSLAAASAAVNLVVKPLARRRRPDREAHAVPLARLVRMPSPRSLPSGHAASAFAFATGAGHVLPRDGAVLRALAALVAYSRVHTGVHFPANVVLGALIGTACAQTATRGIDRHRERARARWPLSGGSARAQLAHRESADLAGGGASAWADRRTESVRPRDTSVSSARRSRSRRARSRSAPRSGTQ